VTDAVEVKRNLDGKTIEYPCKMLVFEPGVRAVVHAEIAEAEPVLGGRLTLEPGTQSYGYFWVDRPYVPYHWLVGGETMLHYVNVGRVATLEPGRVVWDDYAVDILRWPDGAVEVVDEDEVPADSPAALVEFIARAKGRVLDELDAIVDAVELETWTLERG
jgi:hypothetical protein